jgi:hypothetical protein
MGTGLVEFLIFGVVGLWSIIEGVRLTHLKIVQFDPFGPGRYNIMLGVILIGLGVFYYIGQRKKAARAGKEVARKASAEQASDRGGQKAYVVKMFSIIAILALYALLIGWVGYSIACLVFFLLVNKVLGVKSWVVNIAASLLLTVCYYLVFVKFMGMIFPDGALLSMVWGPKG